MKKPGPTEEVQRWLDEIKDAKKRESDFRRDGKRVLKIYGAEKNETTPFNILFSKPETLLPALYSAVPRPVVNRRFKDEDPTGKASATAGPVSYTHLGGKSGCTSGAGITESCQVACRARGAEAMGREATGNYGHRRYGSSRRLR